MFCSQHLCLQGEFTGANITIQHYCVSLSESILQKSSEALGQFQLSWILKNIYIGNVQV